MNGLKTSLKVGMQILEALARANVRPVPVRELAENLGQSEKYLEQLLLPLRRARLVTSTRGPHGGYRLARPPAYITLLEIVQLMQGPLTFCDCPSRQCRDCVSPALWQSLEGCLEASIASITLADAIANRPPVMPRKVVLGPTWVQDGLGI